MLSYQTLCYNFNFALKFTFENKILLAILDRQFILITTGTGTVVDFYMNQLLIEEIRRKYIRVKNAVSKEIRFQCNPSAQNCMFVFMWIINLKTAVTLKNFIEALQPNEFCLLYPFVGRYIHEMYIKFKSINSVYQ